MNPRDELWAALGYHPSVEQLGAHDSKSRYKVVAGGERGGKSYSASKDAIWNIVKWQAKNFDGKKYTRRDMLGWIIGPTYELCEPEFDYICDDVMTLGLISNAKRQISRPKTGKKTITLDFGVIETKSADEVMRIAGVAPDWIIVCEAAQLEYYAWLKLFGRASQRRSPIWASGTFESSLGWYPEWWARWQGPNAQDGKSFSIPTWSNLAVYPGGREDPEIKILEATYPPDLFQERFGAIPCPPSTLVFREFSVGKHVVRMRANRDADKFEEVYEGGELSEIKLPWGYDVEIWIDPGYASAYAVSAVMRIGEKVYNFDEVYMQHKTAREVIDECMGKWWWPKVTYGVMDIAGRQHQGMESHEEIWQALAKIPIYSQTVGIADGIERHRTFLSRGPNAEPYIYHDPDRCPNIIREYQKYKYPDVKDNRPIREIPIDASNHLLKAVAYGLVWDYGFVKHERLNRIWESPFSDWTDRMARDVSYLPIELR